MRQLVGRWGIVSTFLLGIPLVICGNLGVAFNPFIPPQMAAWPLPMPGTLQQDSWARCRQIQLARDTTVPPGLAHCKGGGGGVKNPFGRFGFKFRKRSIEKIDNVNLFFSLWGALDQRLNLQSCHHWQWRVNTQIVHSTLDCIWSNEFKIKCEEIQKEFTKHEHEYKSSWGGNWKNNIVSFICK